jgi:ribosome-binding factor A
VAGHASHHPYPRTARINEILRAVVAESLLRLGDVDERLALLTVTGVDTAADLKSAVIYLDTLPAAAVEALEEYRLELQATVNAQTRMKRTPRLRFVADPAVAAGTHVEEVIRRLHRDEPHDV